MSDPQTTASGADEPAPGRGEGHNAINTDAMQWVSAIVALVGLWVIVSPLIFESTTSAIWNNAVVGAAIFILAGYNFLRMSRYELAIVGVAALVFLLGVWLIASPFLIEMGSDELLMSTTVAGVIVAGLSGFNAYANNKADTPEYTRARV